MKLIDALELKRGDVVSLIGSGGKTSALVRMMHECQVQGWRVLLTTTTRIGLSELSHFPTHCYLDEVASFQQSPTLFIYSRQDTSKVYGLNESELASAIMAFQPDVVLIEADGSRKKPLKLPYPHEPVVPSFSTKLVGVVGLSALGEPCIESCVYNPDAIMATQTLTSTGQIHAKTFSSIIANGIWGQISPTIPRYAFINQTEPHTYRMGIARFIARCALQHAQSVSRILIGSLLHDDPVHEVVQPVSAVVLAAGRSSRMGQSKILMPWHDGQTIIEQIIKQLQHALVSEVIVVTGRQSAEVSALVQSRGARTVFNPDYQEGEMLSSLKVGLNALSITSQACLIV